MFNWWIYNFEKKLLLTLENNPNVQSIDKFIVNLPAGVYTTLRTVNKKNSIFQFSYHLNRINESFLLAGFNLQQPLVDLKNPLRNIFQEIESEEIRIRLFIAFEQPNECMIFTEPLTQPTQNEYDYGVMVCTNHLSRNNPKAKLTSFIKKSKKIKDFCKANGFEESIMINKENELLEGLSSNFFVIIREKFYTAEEEILKGSVREIVIEEAKMNNFSVIMQPIKTKDISIIDEAFITSTSRGVLPVVKIDEFTIGNGKPGKITKLISEKFSRRILSDAEEI